MSKTSNVLIALAAGAVAGIVAGILFAPDRGSETRRKISDSTKDLLDKTKARADKFKSKFSRAENGVAEETYS